MKLSVSLAPEDVAVLDEFVRSAGLRSRSSGLQHAVRLLRHPQLEQDYAAAWAEWEDSGDSAGWESTAADGFSDAER